MCRKLICWTFFALVLGMAGSVSADLIGHWRFDEGSGTVAYDSSGNDHDGTIYGSPSWVSGVGGNALEFDGTDDYVGTGESLLDNMSEFTLACWVRAGNPGSDRIGLIGQNDLIEMGFMSGNVEMWTNVTSTTSTQWTFEDNTWHHITVSGGATGTKIYFDGELAVTGRGSANYGTSTFPVNIGGGGVWDTSGNWFLGQIDDVRIYNHALSEIEILTAMEGAGEAWPYASDPEPADGTFRLDTWARLSWMPGSTSDSHDVYFGDNFEEVNDGTGGTFQGNQTSTLFVVGLPGCSYPDGLVPGTTYYWRVDEVEADGVTKHKGTVWSFSIPSSKAHNPVPPDGAEFVAAGVTFTWAAGLGAELHTVYLGDDPDAVANAVGGIPQKNTRYYTGALEFDRKYYWRVDEFDGAVTHKGDVWSFTTMPADALQRPSAVSTFQCMGVYWSPQDGSSDNVCQVRYRRVDSTEWKEALPLWYDDRELGVNGGSNIVYPPQYRGSIVNLEPGTTYEIELRLLNTGTTEIFTAATWSEDFLIAKTVYLPAGTTNQTLRITESGSPDGYILYTASDGGSVIDVDHNQDYCITVNASYIIIRGVNLKGARNYGIRLYDCHDVVIEQCDISDFSSIEDDGWGNRGSAIFSHSSKLKRIIVQRNKIHHPYSDTNSWSEYRAKYGSSHPRGPRAIGYANSAGNHVIRYNEIYSDEDHYFDDCMGSGNNNFPNRDSDIYGNYVANCWDDGIEAEDDNCNVRIWGNFIEWTFVKIAVAPTNVGPVYVWRNVAGVARGDDIQSWNDVSRGGFLKTDNGGGKTYVFHNTLLQPEPPRGIDYPLGCGRGLGWGGRMLNVMSRNNILHVHRPGAPSIKDCTGVTYHDPLGNYDYDLYSGYIDAAPGAEPNGIHDVPRYDRNNGEGEYALDTFSPGYDAGMVIPNFNDNYNGAAPDIGAHEADSTPMEFGVNAYQ
jgi:hypothetical protein